MASHPELIAYLIKYGYLTIFILVFSQEIGLPNPIPNELFLIYMGYLCAIGTFTFSAVVFTAFCADFLGTNLLFFTFLRFGNFILNHKPRWLPISEAGIAKATHRIEKGGLWAFFLGRITPFIRGYTSVAAGFMHISPKKFIPIVLFSAFTWSLACVTFGWFFGNIPFDLSSYFTDFEYIKLP